MRNLTIWALPIVALSAALPTQDRIVALTSTTQLLVRQVMDGKKCSAVRCGIKFEKAFAKNAGGTAYDSRSGIVWVSNGLALTAYIAPTGTSAACKRPCAVTKIPQPVAGKISYCTGLAYLDAGVKTSTGGLGPYGRLYCLYSTNIIGVADVKGCTVFNWKFCSIANSIGTGNITGGLACDDLGRRLFVGTFTGTSALAYVFNADKVCSAICKFPIGVSRGACGTTTTPLKAMTGLAFNGCTKFLYATDGVQTIFGLFSMSATGACKFTHRACCKVPTERYTGLALVPPPQARLGKRCSAKSCNACLPTISTTGDAVLGNALFRIILTNGPSNTSAYALAIGIGGCSNPGVNLGFCQPALISLAAPGPFVFLFPATPSALGCNRTASIPLPLAANSAACGLKLSFQWVMACKGNPTGNAVSDCLTVTLSSL